MMFIEVTQIFREKNAEFLSQVEKTKVMISTSAISKIGYLDARHLPAKTGIHSIGGGYIQVAESYEDLKKILIPEKY